MVRTRTIREAAAYFRESDPDTCLTETAIRTLLRTGVVNCTPGNGQKDITSQSEIP